MKKFIAPTLSAFSADLSLTLVDRKTSVGNETHLHRSGGIDYGLYYTYLYYFKLSQARLRNFSKRLS